MDRRNFLKGTAAAGLVGASAGLAGPALSQGAAARTLRFVPQANLANFDPIWGTQYVVRNGAAMVWDTLYGFDAELKPQRQMAEAEQVSADGLTWDFRLRPGLKFHDGSPVLAKDVVASLTRWSARDPMGQMLKAIQQELVAVDDRNFRWVLKKPYPKMLMALGKNSTPMAFIMPERLAKTDPFTQVAEFIGSGPMRFKRDEWNPGARAVFEKFADYVPRDEPSSWLAGGKRMGVDRIEWLVMPDAATASAALQNGEVDWWENPITDLVPQLRRNRNLRVDIADPLGNIGTFRMNHTTTPFNDVKARRAVLMAMSQEDYMRALVGDDDKLWKPLPGYFTPGTPLYSEAGGEILKGPRNLDAAKQMLAESGYNGTPGHLHRGAGPADHEGAGRRHRRPAEAARHERRFRRDGLGHHRPAPRHEEPDRPGRLVDVPQLACRRRLHQPGGLQRGAGQWRRRLVRLAGHPRGRDRGRRLV